MKLRQMVMAMAVVTVGCGSSTTTTTELGPTGNPTLAFSNPAAGEPQCFSIGDDVDVQLPLLVAVEEVTLRPPGGCQGATQCGWLALYADGVLNNETAARAIDLLVYKLGDPIHDGTTHAGTNAPDTLEARVEVIADETGEVLVDQDGDELTDTIQLVIVPDCDAL